MLRVRLGLIVLALLGLAGAAWAQFGFGGFREGVGYAAPKFRPPGVREQGFTFCKLMYRSVRREPMGMGWSTDYPYAGINLMIRFSELTKAPVSMDETGQPNHWVVRLTDPALFDCPFLMASDVGTLAFDEDEVPKLREYLLKGGFLWVDDFWGTAAWEQWRYEISRVLPFSEYPIIDVPPGHEILRDLFDIRAVPQVTNIQFWRRNGGRTTSERGYESRDVHFRAIVDHEGRIMVLMTHNSDIGDSWEREGEDVEYFHQFSPDGYALAMDVLVYVMTH